MMSDEPRHNCGLPVRVLVTTARLIIILSLTVYAAAAQSPPSATANSEAQVLELSKPIERQLSSGEIHAYKISLEVGMFLDAAVNQRGVDVLVHLLEEKRYFVSTVLKQGFDGLFFVDTTTRARPIH